jgi:SecD/SecF fusion protein
MQNKSALLIFTVLLALSTLYILSFSWVSSRFEGVAKEYSLELKDSLSAIYSGSQLDSAMSAVERKFLKDSANAEIYPLLGHSYEYVKKRELNLGLDLRGGMSVVLEVSIPDLVINLSDYNNDENFVAAIARARELQKDSQDDFITLFDQAWKEKSGGKELWRIFHNLDNKDKFASGISDEEVITILKAEAETAINNTENIIRRRIDKFGVAQPVVQKQSFSGRILVELPGVDDRDRVRKNLKATANLEFWETYKNNVIAQNIVAINEALAKSINPEVFEADSLKNAAASDSTLTADAATDPLASPDSLASDSTKVDDGLDLSDNGDEAAADSAEEMSKEEIEKRAPFFRYFALNNTPGSPIVGFVKESDTSAVNRLLARPEAKNAMPADLKLLWAAKPSADGFFALYAIKDLSLKGKPKLDGASIVDAFQDFDEYGTVSVSMNMDNEGAVIWGQMTREAAAQKDAIAIVMDEVVYSAPSVNEEIPGGRSQITLGGNNLQEQLQEAKDLSDLLKAGALPAPARIVDESIVGPSLGAENIRSGMISFVVALLVVLLYMIFYYGKAGLVSNVALIANLFFLIGALASLGAALTLPGIAGIVLTIGMAVDTNVLIFERIREEMRLGKGLGMALKDGYRNAYSAIIDGNITTLLTAIVLFIFGTGPIRGFATILIIGILTSLFSGILITRLIFFNRLEKKKSISFETGITKAWFLNSKIQFVQKRKLFYAISGIVIVAGIISMFTKGMNYGVDFEGGRSYIVRFESEPNIDQLRDELAVAFTDETGSQGNPEVKRYGSTGEALKITTNFLINSTDENADELVNNKLIQGLEKVGVNYEIENTQKVDPTISDDFRSAARNSTIFSLIIIFLYIFFRFRKWEYATGALIALAHDVLVVLSLFSILGGLMPFTMEVDQAFIAAILTIIGYSINDTVIIFDRIREYLKEHHKDDQVTVINKALNSTLGRTINTSLTTWIVLLVIFIFGPSNIMGFIFALLVGIAVGTYSSLFIATPLVIDLGKKEIKK